MTTATWLEALAHELQAHGVDEESVAAIVVEAAAHLEDEPGPPLEVFGTPAGYAATVVAAVAPRSEPTRVGAPVLHAQGVVRTYRGARVLDGVDLVVRGGQVVLLVGDNGAGKSTLLRCLVGVEKPDAGRIDCTRSVGYAPQDGGLASHLSADEHFVLFGRGRGLGRVAARAEGRRIAGQLGWEPAGAPIAGELSGGTAQKLSVVLAALGAPRLLLLDEPYQGLDPESTRRFWEQIWAWRDQGRAALVVTHAQDALERADSVLELSRGVVV